MSDQSNWYKTFFDGLFLEMWTKAMSEDYTAAEVKFIKGVTALAENSNILDVPCGFGRHSISFAQEGYSVTGIDIAEGYIKELQDVAQKQKLPITAVQADILDYEINGKFDLAICLGNSFSYFDYYSMLHFAQKIYKVLIEGGNFLIHTGALAESLLPSLKENEWMQVKDMLFLTKRIYHSKESILQCDYSIIRQEEREDKTAYQYIFTLGEVRRLLTQAGFTQIEQYNGFEKLPYKLGDRQVYLVAKK
jgi:cyclopropane fatty-acyl-phospholipid synthase-like methyltransferase